MSLSQAGQNSLSQNLSRTMGMTVKELAQTIEVEKPLTWSERRAQYVPNTDAAGLGYGRKHRDYNRYMSSWNAHSIATRNRELADQRVKTAPTTSSDTSSQSAQVCLQENKFDAQAMQQTTSVSSSTPTIAMPGSRLSIQTKKLKAAGPMTTASGVDILSVPKPTRINYNNQIIRDASGMGYGRTHAEHYWYILPKRPEDCRPLNTTLQLNSW